MSVIKLLNSINKISTLFFLLTFSNLLAVENKPVDIWQNKNQVNTKDEEIGVEFKIKSWLRNEAIDVVGLEIRSMKKKAYEYSEDELEKMIIEQENIIIKKKGWKAVRMVALSSLGLGFLPFI